MIFPCHFIQPLIINAYPPTYGKVDGHLFSFFIAHNGHPTFFWDNLSWTHLGAIGYGVNDAGLSQLENFCTNHFLHMRIQSPLRLSYWFGFLFQVDVRLQTKRLIPFKSEIFHPITCLFFLRTSNRLFSCEAFSSEEITTRH